MKTHSFAAVLAAVLVGFGIWGIFIWRARENTLTSLKLCVVLATLIEGSDRTLGTPGVPGYVYYHAHPDELRAAHRANRRVLEQLPCKPKETP